MKHVTGWTVLSKDYRSVLRIGGIHMPESERWVPIGEATFLTDDGPETPTSAVLFEFEHNARNTAGKVGGHVHRVDRQEPQT